MRWQAAAMVPALLLLSGGAAAGGFLCKDEPELTTWKAELGTKARRKLERDDLQRGLLASYETQLRKAREGDAQSRHQIGRWWAICQVGEGILAPEQQQRTVEYLQTGTDSDSRQTLTLLGLFSAMGWGTPQSYETAYQRFEAAQRDSKLARRISPEDFVEETGLYSAPKEQQRAAYAFHVLMSELMMLRPSHAWPQLVRGRGKFEEGIPVGITVGTCPMNARLAFELSAAVDPVAATQYFQQLVDQIPQAGLPCTDNAGGPFERVYETTLFPPEPDPFGG